MRKFTLTVAMAIAGTVTHESYELESSGVPTPTVGTNFVSWYAGSRHLGFNTATVISWDLKENAGE